MLRTIRMRGGAVWRPSQPYCTGGGGGGAGGEAEAAGERRLRYGREFGGHLLRDDRSVLLVRYRAEAEDSGAQRRAEAVAQRLGVTAVAVHARPREQRNAAARDAEERWNADAMAGEGDEGLGGGDDKLKLRLSREEAEELQESLPRRFLEAVEREGGASKSGVFSLDVTEQELCLRFVRAKGPGLFLRSSKWMVDFGRQHRRDFGYSVARRRGGGPSRTSRPSPLLRALGTKGMDRQTSEASASGQPWALSEPIALPWGTPGEREGEERARGGGAGSLLVAAADGEEREPLRVLDVCAGLGNDAFLLAKAGGHVLMLERHPLVHLLLRDGLERARALADATIAGQRTTRATDHIDEEFVAAVGRLGLAAEATDALPLLEALKSGEECGLRRPHIVFVDPMHSTKNTKGRGTRQAQLPTFKMQIASCSNESRDIVGSSSREEQSRLLELALGAASHRVVYKRPQYAEALPSHLPAPLAEYNAKAVCYSVFAGVK